jgi:hypothetical protein
MDCRLKMSGSLWVLWHSNSIAPWAWTIRRREPAQAREATIRAQGSYPKKPMALKKGAILGRESDSLHALYFLH